MPKVTKRELPGTVRRSSAKAQRTWAKTLESAHEQYASEERAHRTAIASLKHSFERKGDRWVEKDRKGPSDPRARRGGTAARQGRGETFGGVDLYGNTKQELYERARRLGVEGRSKMTKKELARAIATRQRSRGR
ncbi:MAG TPA: ChaB family protein [Actinomycetota bacterium]|nr:ChaB family protein [Actinomycetota bacterium]